MKKPEFITENGMSSFTEEEQQYFRSLGLWIAVLRNDNQRVLEVVENEILRLIVGMEDRLKLRDDMLATIFSQLMESDYNFYETEDGRFVVC